jgi:hypothetical protein
VPFDSCDCFTVKDRNWVSMKSLLQCRQYPSSAVIRFGKKEVMIVAGGFNEFSKSIIKDVEVFDGDRWFNDKVAPMPKPVYRSCLVKLNDTHLISVGGRTTYPSINQTRSSYFYNALDNKWTRGPGFFHQFLSQEVIHE